MTSACRTDAIAAVACAAIVGLASACVSVGPLPPRRAPEPKPVTLSWYSPIGRHHPLAGQIWSVEGARFVHRADLVAALVAARVVLLGERHDNVDHHRMQAALLSAMVEAGRRPAVAFEMFDADEQPKIDAALAADRSSDAVARAVEWSKKGWPPWEMYARIADVAIARGLPIVAANLPLREARALAKVGAGAIDAGEATRLGLDTKLPEALDASLREELVASHCGHLQGAAVDRMVLAQRARDATMAERMRSAGGDGIVLVAGAGHVRKDRGVPHRFEGFGALPKIVSVAMVEVEEGRLVPTEYAERWSSKKLPFDFVVFTPRVSDDDSCAAFRRPRR